MVCGTRGGSGWRHWAPCAGFLLAGPVPGLSTYSPLRGVSGPSQPRVNRLSRPGGGGGGGLPVIPREKDASLGCWGEAPGHSGQAAQQDEGRTTVAPMGSEQHSPERSRTCGFHPKPSWEASTTSSQIRKQQIPPLGALMQTPHFSCDLAAYPDPPRHHFVWASRHPSEVGRLTIRT